MALKRMDNVIIVVDDLEAARDFFAALGMEVEGRAPIEGPWVDRCIDIEGTRAEIIMMRTPDGQGKIELDKFHRPKALKGVGPREPVNTRGIRRIMFAVDDLDETLERVRPHGATLVGDVVTYEDIYRLCYIRGPEGILIGLAEELRAQKAARGEKKPPEAKAPRKPKPAPEPKRSAAPKRAVRRRPRA